MEDEKVEVGVGDVSIEGEESGDCIGEDVGAADWGGVVGSVDDCVGVGVGLVSGGRFSITYLAADIICLFVLSMWL